MIRERQLGRQLKTTRPLAPIACACSDAQRKTRGERITALSPQSSSVPGGQAGPVTHDPVVEGSSVHVQFTP